MSVWNDLRAAEQNWSGDEDRQWAVLLGTLLAVGLTFRTAAHVWVAIGCSAVYGEDIDPELTGRDVTLSSPVTGLQSEQTYDLVARLLACGFGIVAWDLIALSHLGTGAVAFIAANLAVCVLDPLFYAFAHILD